MPPLQSLTIVPLQPHIIPLIPQIVTTIPNLILTTLIQPQSLTTVPPNPHLTNITTIMPHHPITMRMPQFDITITQAPISWMGSVPFWVGQLQGQCTPGTLDPSWGPPSYKIFKTK